MILLDTHAWFWWLTAPDLLSGTARAAIERAGSVAVSALSCYEIGLLVSRGRLELYDDVERWIRRALAVEGTLLTDLHPRVALGAGRLGPEFPGDPIDRMLYATAVDLGARLVTKDRRLRAADPARTLW